MVFFLFWIFFAVERPTLPAYIVDFELCFILPDLFWIVGVLWMASHWLRRSDARGIIASAGAGGALVFLGLLDGMFNIRHHQYTDSLSTGILNVLINLGCVLFGLWNLIWATQKSELGKLDP
jgi:hypothetical protein